ncbi:gustatory receptor for sugar taste 64e-like [Zophobas morio]|uniref:gustatory receptor for sugar taste 64e-like n=1 Tax=Zophobas morio TaxID=2755281 RepID=UPI00308361B9
MAQSFGLLPVRGVTGENYNDLSFSWYLKRVFYSQVLIFGSCFVAVVAFFRMVYVEYSLSNLIEHVLSIIYVCSQIPGDDPDKYLTYFSRNYPHLFDFFEFSAPLAVFAVVMNFLNVFSWNFLDAFLMIISLGLSQKFQEVTRRIHVKHHWMKIREDYNKISILCKTVNKEISTLIIVSFATNMFFITSQLYWSLSHKSTAIESIYFFFSFGLLVLRTVAVILFASNINDESKKSMSYLLSLNSDAYSSEIERFAYQIHCQPVALTGNDFFTITKGLLLGMAGSIVTYELFLIQSNGAINYF